MNTFLSPWAVSEQLLAVALASVVVMALLWIVQWKTEDASVVDAVWALGVGTAAVFVALTGPGDPWRRVLVGVIGGAWGLRLGLYLLFNRVLGKPEDGRYKNLRRKWGSKAHFGFFVFFQLQAIFILMFALPSLATSHSGQPLFGPSRVLDVLALCVAVASLVGESTADRQLARFRADPANRGRTCRVGLWAYSRHPNYFFEWLHWFVWVLLAAGSPVWWLTLTGPVFMYLFLMKVTGIPHTEAQALRTRGEDYRRYQAETNMFFPWFPRKELRP